jgi:hypothetical protein
MQAVVPRRLSLNMFLLATFCLPCGTCSLDERGLVEACVVHIGELVELVRHLTHVVALCVIHLSPLTLHQLTLICNLRKYLYGKAHMLKSQGEEGLMSAVQHREIR